MENSKMRKHVSVVAVIQIAFGALGLIGALALNLVFDFAGSFVHDDEVATMVMNAMKLILPITIGFFSVLKLVGGIGLLCYKNWARYFVIVLAAIGCLNIPIGTLIGVYSLWVLLQDETIKLFTETVPLGSGV